MKAFLAASLIVVASTGSGFAESCEESFVRLLVHGNGEAGPIKIHVTQQMKGAKPTMNWSYQIDTGHWMSEMIEPANGQWTLVYKDTMYSSGDKGKSWQKVRGLDSAQNTDDATRKREEDAKSARNIACGEEEIDGVVYGVVEGDYTSTVGMTLENHHKYWVARDTGWIARVSYKMSGNGFEITTLQRIEKAPDLTLPMPE